MITTIDSDAVFTVGLLPCMHASTQQVTQFQACSGSMSFYMDKALARGIGITIAGIASFAYGTSETVIHSDPAGVAMGEGLVMLFKLPFIFFGIGAMVVGPICLLAYAYRRVAKK